MAIRDLVPFTSHRREGLTRRGGYESPFTRMHEELDRMFRDVLGDWPTFHEGGDGDWTLSPDVDVQETDKEIRIKAELPGVADEDIDVQLEGRALVISGEKKEESEDKEGDVYRSECRYGSFSRTIPLSSEVDGEKVDATFKKGVLRISLPKLSQGKSGGNRIKIRQG